MLAAAAAVVVLAGAGTWTAVAGDDAPPVRRADRVMAVGDGVRLDTSYFTAGPGGGRPAVLLATASAAERPTYGSRRRASHGTDTRS